MDQLRGHSITYRIAVGPQQGRKVFTLQTLPGIEDPFSGNVGQTAGFSLHAGVATKASQREKLERLCRYITRPAISEKWLSLTNQRKVRYELKTPYRDGTTHVIFEPVDFIAKLAALVPRPRVNLTRFHSVFARNSKHRREPRVCCQTIGRLRRPTGSAGSTDHYPCCEHEIEGDRVLIGQET